MGQNKDRECPEDLLRSEGRTYLNPSRKPRAAPPRRPIRDLDKYKLALATVQKRGLQTRGPVLTSLAQALVLELERRNSARSSTRAHAPSNFYKDHRDQFHNDEAYKMSRTY